MSFFKVNRDISKDSSGILYILILEIEGETVYKIGVTKRKIEDRVCEILTDHYRKFRYFCKCTPKRFRKVDDVYNKETLMHRFFKDYRFTSSKVFDGSTELFYNIELDVLLEMYDRCLEGELSGQECSRTFEVD